MKKGLVYLILGIILVVGASLRNFNLNVWPREGATFDEFAWTFLGVSLWEKGTPTSWSPHPQYKNRVEYRNPQGAHFVLVSPYLEHPPLFGLVAGGFAMVNGVRNFNDVTIAKIRPLALILGIMSIFMVFLLASSVYGDKVGLVASGIYSIVPSVAIGSRLVQNENFFIPFFLFALYLTHRYIRHPKSNILYLTAVICGLLPIAKIPWVAAAIAVVVMFLYAKKWKEVGVVAVSVAAGLFAFFVWGFVWDKELFINLWKLQLARYDLAFDSLFVLFRDPVIVDRALVDGWIYFGWAAIVWLLTRDIKKNLPIIMGFLAYAAIFVFAVPSEPLHGWYRYPFYPFLTIATAVFLAEYFNKNYLVSALFYVTTGLSMFGGSWAQAFGFSFPVLRTYLVAMAVGALPALFPSKKIVRLSWFINIGIFLLIILLSCWTVILYNEQ